MNKRIKIILGLLLLSCISYLQAQELPEKAEDISPLLIGEKLPDAQLMDEKGEIYSLTKVLSQGPAVIVFYRGSWCPFCNNHLAELAKIEKQIVSMGYSLIAITPDDYENLAHTGSKNNISYKLFSDPDAKLIQSVGIAFGSAADRHGILPAPALLVVNDKQEIVFEHINPNFRERIKGDFLITVLKALK